MRYRGLRILLLFNIMFLSISIIKSDAIIEKQTSPVSNNVFAMMSDRPIDPVETTPNKLPLLENKPVTLLTFNIHSARDEEGNVHLDQIIDEIKGTGAEIIGLQEVERFMPRTGYVDQVKRIADELDYHFYYGGNLNILGARYGNAILSKFPIVMTENHSLPRVKLEPRGLIEAQIDIDDHIIKVYVTHLGLDAQERMKQVPFIYDIISNSNESSILMGDFNNRPDSLEMEIMSSGFIDVAHAFNMGDEYTYSLYNSTLNGRLDRIYTSEEIGLIEYMHMPSEISDHCGIIVKIDIRP